jgi:hypothetical protein
MKAKPLEEQLGLTDGHAPIVVLGEELGLTYKWTG